MSTLAARDGGESAASWAASAGREGAPGNGTLALLEVLDRDDHVRQYLRIERWPVSVGRALDNDLVLDDPHTAAHHLRIAPDAGGVFVQVGDTVNGLRAAGRHFGAGQRVAVGMEPLRLDIGDSHLCLRLAAHAVTPELPLRTPRNVWGMLGPTLIAGVLVLAALVFGTWLETDPADQTRALGSMLVTLLAASAVWCGGWSLVSKIFTRRSHFLWHLRVMLWGMLAMEGVGALMQLLAFSLSWPAASDFAFVPMYALGAGMLYFHVLGVEPRRPSRVRMAAVSMFVVGTALSLWFNHQNRDQFGDELYMNHLFPPALRLAPATDTATFVEGLSSLKPTLDDKAKKDESGDDAPGGEEE